MNQIKKAREDLANSWVDQRANLEQAVEFQNFNKECEAAEEWMQNREGFLNTPNEDDDNVDSMIKKHEDLGKAINNQEEKIATLLNYANQLVHKNNRDTDAINKKLEEVLNRWKKLKDALIEKKSKLGESQTLQQFSRDADEIEILINEKLQTALDDSYKDPTNIESKNQKQQAFEAELTANEDRVNNVLDNGNKLIEKQKCGGNEDAVKQRLKYITEQWQYLIERTKLKTIKLKEANKRRDFNAAVKDLDFWLTEIETLLKSEDTGRDSAAVQNFMKKHQNLEADIAAREDKIKDMNALADSLIESDQLDKPELQEKRASVNERYERIKTLAAYRQDRLNEANTLFRFFRDLSDQESWILEKKLLLNTKDYGRDLTAVNNLRKKHKRFESEIAAHEPTIRAIQNVGQKLMAETNIDTPEIERKLQNLENNWQELNNLANNRADRLEESLIFQQFATNLEEEDAWIAEKAKLLLDNHLGDSLATAQGLIKKHELFEKDYQNHMERFNDIQFTGQQLINEGNLHAAKILEKLNQLKDKLDKLKKLADERKQKLLQNYDLLQYLWKADVVENWMNDKEKHIKSEDPGRDLSSVKTLIAVRNLKIPRF